MSCASRVRDYLTDVPGVSKAKVDFGTGKARVDYDDEQTKPETISHKLEVYSDGKYKATIAPTP